MPRAPRGTASPPPPALDTDSIARLRLAVMRLARRLRQHADQGTSPAQMSALAAIVRVGPVSLGDLAAVEQVGPSTLTKIVAALESAGLVERAAAPHDRRVAFVTATEDGRVLLQRWRSSATSYLATRIAALDPEDVRALTAAVPALERLVSA